MARSTDIAGYVYAADTYCPPCVLKALPTGPGGAYDGWALAPGAAPMSVEDNLSEIAAAFGVDRMDERAFDSGDFPKVIFQSDAEDSTCGRCHRPLAA